MSAVDSEVSMRTGNTLRVSGCPPGEPGSRGDAVAANPSRAQPGQAAPIDTWLRRVAVLRANWRRIAEALGKGYAMTREEANRMAGKLFDRG